MPTIVAKKDGTCTAVGCGGRIRGGEYAAYSRVQGIRHPECADRPTERRNERAGPCARCGILLEAQQGRLQLHEERHPDGGFLQRYTLTCPKCDQPLEE